MNRVFSSRSLSTKSQVDYNIFHDLDTNIQTITFNKSNSINPLSKQGIKINHKIYRLLFFEKSPTNLTYIFEKDVMLCFYFDSHVKMMMLKCPKFKINTCKEVSFHDVVEWDDNNKELNYISALYEN